MRTKLCIATAIAGSMLLTGLVSGSAQAAPTPVLKSNADSGIVTLVGRKGGGGGGGMKGLSGRWRHERIEPRWRRWWRHERIEPQWRWRWQIEPQRR